MDGGYEAQVVQVKFCLKYRTSYGQTVKLLGSHPQLGEPGPEQAIVGAWGHHTDLDSYSHPHRRLAQVARRACPMPHALVQQRPFACVPAGCWDLNKAVDLQWTEGDRWMATMDLPAGSVYEYK